MSFSIAEEEIATIGPKYLEGTYAAWNYFQTLKTTASKEFSRNFKAKYGKIGSQITLQKLHTRWCACGLLLPKKQTASTTTRGAKPLSA